MAVYRRGNTWWFKFRFEGQAIRESAKTSSKTVAREAERARRRRLELAINGLTKRKRPLLFAVGIKQWLDSRAGLSLNTVAHYRLYADRLVAHFGQKLISDIGEEDIASLIRDRQRKGFKPRLINFELAVLRMVLKNFGVWDEAKGSIKPLREPRDVGRAISREHEERMLAAISHSRSPALLPLFVLGVDTGLRANELRLLRHRDLTLTWRNGTIVQGWLTVRKSKTEGGTGRTVPLTRRACGVLTLWLARFPEASPYSFVFPAYKIGFTGNSRRSDLYAINLTQPIGSWKKAWRDALRTATKRAAEEHRKINGASETPLPPIHYRWHDCRHTFISRLAENPAVSEQTLMALAGHVSKAMLARYSHIRSAAKQAAIATLEQAEIDLEWAQKWAQSQTIENPVLPN